MRNDILTDIYSYCHFTQKPIKNVEAIESIVMEKENRKIVVVVLDILKELNHADNYFEGKYLYMEYEGFAKIFTNHLQRLMIKEETP